MSLETMVTEFASVLVPIPSPIHLPQFHFHVFIYFQHSDLFFWDWEHDEPDLFPVPRHPNDGSPAIYLDNPCCGTARNISKRAFYRVIVLLQLKLNIIEGFRFSPLKFTWMDSTIQVISKTAWGRRESDSAEVTEHACMHCPSLRQQVWIYLHQYLPDGAGSICFDLFLCGVGKVAHCSWAQECRLSTVSSWV